MNGMTRTTVGLPLAHDDKVSTNLVLRPGVTEKLMVLKWIIYYVKISYVVTA